MPLDTTKYGLHGTSVQALQPKHHSIKKNPHDYVMFHGQPTEETVQSLFPIRVYPDGRCLFRSVASRLEQRLLICPRNNAGVPVDPSLFELEKSYADLLRESTVNVLKSNLPFFRKLEDAVLHTLCEKESMTVFLTDLNGCLNVMNLQVSQKYLVLCMMQIVQYILLMNQMFVE